MVCKLAIALLCISTSSFSGWVTQNSGTTSNLLDITAHHGNDNQAWACGEGGTIVYTSNGGVTWTRQSSGTTRTLYSIAFIEMSGAPVIAVGDSGTILKTTNFGTTWFPVASPTTQALRGISDFSLYIVGDSGTILHSTNIGQTWFAVASPTTARLNAVCGFNPSYAVGEQGVVVRQSGSINPWTLFSTGTSDELFSVPMFGTANIAVGERGLIFRSTSFGTSWYTQPNPATQTLRAVEFSVNNSSHIYCVGDGGTILKSTNEGVFWGRQQSATTRNLRGVFFYLNDNIGWAAGDSGTILHTTDGGGGFVDVEEQPATIPERASLHQNYPNPFNPSTKIVYRVWSRESVSLKVFDILGREVAVLVDEVKAPGSYEVRWDGADQPSGVYFYRMITDGFMETRKLILMR